MQMPSTLRSILLPLTVLVTLAAASAPALASTSYYLKFNGIDGEATSKGHEKWSEIDAFQWGVTATPGGISGGGASAGKPQFSDFNWSQSLDSSFTSLFSNIAAGRPISTATVDFSTNSGQGAEVVFFKMSFSNVLLTELNLSGTNGSPLNMVGSFNYEKIKFDYWTIDARGGLGTHSEASFDLRTGKGSVPALSLLFARGLSGPQVTPVPEPESWALLLAGLGLMGTVARRRMKREA